MKRTFAYGAATNQGKWPTQEDGFFVDPGSGLFAVADGFGGRGQGDMAAKLALLACRAREGANPAATTEGNTLSPTQVWQRSLFTEINKKLLQWNEKRPPATRGGCSLILASVEQERGLVVTNCGACSAFILRAGRWLPLLSPQCAPRALPDGALYPAQALGLGREIVLETRSLFWEPGDILFLFSSGLAWEGESFQGEISGQVAFRAPGSDLATVAALAAEGGKLPEEALWNQTALAVEALA